MKSFLVIYAFALVMVGCSGDEKAASAPERGLEPREAQDSTGAATETSAPTDNQPQAVAEAKPQGRATKATLREPTGTLRPSADDRVAVHYIARNAAGRVMDSSRERGRPLEFHVAGVIDAWRDALVTMREGQVVRISLPTPRGADAVTSFDLELVSVFAAPPTPTQLTPPDRGVKVTRRGVTMMTLREGKGGRKPRLQDRVIVHFTGWTEDGTMFASTALGGGPRTFSLVRVIAGWTEGLQSMSVGAKTRMWIPAKLGYGDRADKPVGNLIFDVELVGIEAGPPLPKLSRADRRPPRGAKKLRGGTRLRILERGARRAASPKKTSTVRAHYTAWTRDGTVYDSSLDRPEGATFPVSSVVPGWSEGLRAMKKGQRARIWVPASQAYAGAEGKPAGPLIYEVELLDVMRSEG